VRIPISHLLRNFLIGFIENDLMKNYNSKIPVFGEKCLLTVIREKIQGGV